MTNYEKYHKEMIEHGYMDVQDGKPTTCQTSCSKCDLYRNDTGCLVTLFFVACRRIQRTQTYADRKKRCIYARRLTVVISQEMKAVSYTFLQINLKKV